MSDGVQLSQGTADGAVIATDQDAGAPNAHYQLFKQVYGALNAFVLAAFGAGAVDAGTGRVTLASDDPAVAKLGTIDTDTGNIATSVAAINTKLASGTVIGDVNLGATDNAVLDAIAASVAGTLTVGSHAVTNAGTFAVQADTELTTGDLDTGAGTDTRAVIGLVGSKSGGGEIIPGSATDGLLVNLGTNNDVTVTGTVTANIAAGTNNIGDVDVLSIAAGDNNIGNVDIASIAAGDNNIGNVDIASALPAGTNAIGKLAANSGVDIGDVDVTSIAAGANLIGDVGIQPRAANGLSTMNASSGDGATALTNGAQVIKASAGLLYGWVITNPNVADAFVQFYNTAAASVTVGTTNPLFTIRVPALVMTNILNPLGITFSNAGWSWAATSTAAGNGALTTALDAVVFYA